MRHTKERRRNSADASYPLEDSDHVLVSRDRRHLADRRLENLAMEERQMLLSEIPWLTFKSCSDDD
ncbi:MAG: hypothetical protein JSU75_04355 [Gammaproteobacteria bacterium]|nr:MAG: hypothetical protein JSU75_04355 [Gammaproteobacteria bacterium]